LQLHFLVMIGTPYLRMNQGRGNRRLLKGTVGISSSIEWEFVPMKYTLQQINRSVSNSWVLGHQMLWTIGVWRWVSGDVAGGRRRVLMLFTSGVGVTWQALVSFPHGVGRCCGERNTAQMLRCNGIREVHRFQQSTWAARVAASVGTCYTTG